MELKEQIWLVPAADGWDVMVDEMTDDELRVGIIQGLGDLVEAALRAADDDEKASLGRELRRLADFVDSSSVH